MKGKIINFRNFIILFFIIIFTSLLTCNGIGDQLTGSKPAIKTGLAYASLVKADSCESVAQVLKDNLIKNMENRIDENLKTALKYYDEGCVYDVYPTGLDGENAGSDAPQEYSETNVQTAGVDEADFFKTDGSYIYIIAGSRFKIIDSWPPETASVISETEIEGTPKKLYINGNKALVYSSIAPDGYSYEEYYRECTYGYDCEFTGDGTKLKISIFDVSDRTDPVLTREMKFNGSYLNSRKVNNYIHTAITFPEVIIEGIKYWPDGLGYWSLCDLSRDYTKEQLVSLFAGLKEENTTLIMQADIEDFLPSGTDTVLNTGETPANIDLLNGCGNFYLSQSGDGKGFISIVSLDIENTAPASASSILSRPGVVYADHDSLYLATNHYGYETDVWFFSNPDPKSEATTIHKFNLLSDGTSTEYAASGAVKGRVLNQFSMDEYNNYLRIATTTGQIWNENVHSTVTSLKQNGTELSAAGVIDNIAPGENIRSVRFSNNLVFVVTFKKTDPLFVFDFSDPENPAIKGELKIPGFSTYIHMLDNAHLLTIGYDADDQGSFVWFQGIMLQLFDVSDPENPELMDKVVIGTRGSTSDAATNHLAFNYFAPKGLLAIPMVICEQSEETWASSYGDIMTFSGLMVYNVTLETGFTELGRIQHEEPETESTYCEACSNWWTSSDSKVKRSIFMDDYVFSIATDLINIALIEDLDTIINGIDLED